MSMKVNIVGSGLAGSEAAFQLASAGVKVVLYDMRPQQMTPAHQTGDCAELVCSNSFKSTQAFSAPGILKNEMREFGSLILQAAEKSQVPGGQALAVNRHDFSQLVTRILDDHPNITRVAEEVIQPFEKEGAITLLATGPLTSDPLSQWLAQSTGEGELYFYDAIAPIIEADSIDQSASFLANRHDKGDTVAYINCPLTEDEYQCFVHELCTVELVKPKAFEKERFFNGCQPLETIARSGKNSLRFGPMRPVGLVDPRTGQRPYAVLQLRPENQALTAYNLVGCQTRMKWGDQKRVFGHIPALKNVEYLRMGSIHRNTYVCGPKVLRPDLSLKGHPKVYLAGQITGVEGYLESTACGLLASHFILQRLKKQPHSSPPVCSALGSLHRHIVCGEADNYQPSGIHFGLFDPRLFEEVTEQKKDIARQRMAEQSINNLRQWLRPSLPPGKRIKIGSASEITHHL